MRGPILALALLAACVEPPPRPRMPSADKASLFGDPGLVPTREGERARRELALAGQIRNGLLLLPDVRDVSVDVSLDPTAPTPRVSVALRGTVADEAAVQALVRGVVGPLPEGELHLVVAAAAEPAPRVGLDLPLALALLGLGVSLGIASERARRRRSR